MHLEHLCLMLNNSITWASCVGLDPIDNEVFHLQNTTQTSFSVEASKKHLNIITTKNNNSMSYHIVVSCNSFQYNKASIICSMYLVANGSKF